MNQIILWLQIITSIAIIALIAIQQKGTALGSGFGGSGEFYSTRRGIQKKLHYATIATTAVFFVLSILGLVL